MANQAGSEITMGKTEGDPFVQETTVTPRRYPGSARNRWLIFVVLVLIAGGVLLYWFYSSGQQSTDDAQIDGHIHSISARISGTVTKLDINDNQYVKAGTVLLEIDPIDYQVIADKAKADLAEAEAEFRASQSQLPIVSTTSTNQLSSAEAVVDQSKAGVNAAERQVDVARSRLHSIEAQIRQARANYDRAAHDLERFKALVAKEEISRQQFDSAVADAEGLRAHLESVEAQLQEAQQGVRLAQIQREEQNARLAKTQADLRTAGTAPQQVEVSRARVQSAAAKVDRKRADLEQAQLNLQYTVVKAPLGGIISQRTVEVGQIIQAGQPLLAIVPLDDIWVTANFKENQLAHMRPGQAAIFTVDTFGSKKFKGHVDSLAAATGARFSLFPPENATGNYVKVVQRIPVKIVLEKGQDPEHLLRPGMSVVATVQTR
jgi:membrane fusion protein (multidrug efflux system)